MNHLQLMAIAPPIHLSNPSYPSIRDIVCQAFSVGCLSIDAENQLRYLLRQKYNRSDLTAFMQLQVAVMDGKVRQESRDRQLAQRQKS